MFIEKINFSNFRNLKENTINPNQEINVIYGNNAQGKTNFLESIWLFTGGHSFRGNKDIELTALENGVNSGFCKLSTFFYSQKRMQTAEIIIQNKKKTSVINGINKNSGSALVGKICAVVFSPEHLSLIKDGPAIRRNFIDAAICQIKPSYLTILKRYNRVLMQRNKFLKDLNMSQSDALMLPVWDQKCCELGFEIAKKRYKYIKQLKEIASIFYNGISGEKENIDIKYKPLGIDFKENYNDFKAKYLLQMQKATPTDIKMGSTSVGVHRDDIDILINNIKARTFASQGQQRSIVIAMKLSEAKILEDYIGEPPIILLDDVMSELDNNRQDYILNKLIGRQIFISLCNPETVDLLKKGKRFKVVNGEIFEIDANEEKN